MLVFHVILPLLLQQMQLPSAVPTLALAVAQYIFMLLAALEVRLTLLIAHNFALEWTVYKATLRMLELDVKV